MIRAGQFLGILLLISISGLTGCSSIGPRSLERDRFDYTTAISDSWKDQMLLNMVKIRYADTPVFLDVNSIISQYGLDSAITLNSAWSSPKDGFGGGNIFGIGGVGRYFDRPTITFSPMTGEKFAQKLMNPIPPPSLFSMVQTGFPIDLVFRLCIHTINGVQNRFGAGARARPADPEFYPLLERMRKVQIAGVMGMRITKRDKEEAFLELFFREKVDPAMEADILATRQVLGLDPHAYAFRVFYGSFSTSDKEVAILTRSVLEIIADLASYIEVPDVHVTEKRVNPTLPDQSVTGAPPAPLIRIHSSPERPSDAFITIPYRGYWFWIDDKDLPSKRLFSSLMFVFTLTETETKEGAPIVTIPVGG
ncbi:MAG: hypothetical protein AYP45_12740 [Candidatus Brocadia carolinensis]|uniref:Uncharacterized protein n=1 Tax=Candidatus Brocadia carolinensis TaxID=1004156 RepID=A0A1V4ART8_9BACT|nr:MAG: hypothetical protein AYP45_12740 [Candidatus Brocadia caroliniensis]